jgi:D-xylono/L-arabinono-1,4-lactonase
MATRVQPGIECIFEGICHLGEGPVWNAGERLLYWTDIYNRRIWVFDPADGRSRVFWEGSVQVGGFAFTRRQAMIMCAEDKVWLREGGAAGTTRGRLREVARIPMHPDEVFNDITTDPKGRIFAGTVRRGGEAGCLYRLEDGRPPEKVLKDVFCSNGMTFSLDEKRFYHTNSGKRRVTVFDYERETGCISNPSLFFQGTEEQGIPDGLTLDAENHLWQAFWGVGLVRRFSPAGAVVEEIAIPAKQPSSVMFGGDRLDHLYITTACQGAADLETGMDEGGTFLGGKIYRRRMKVHGRPEWLAGFE